MQTLNEAPRSGWITRWWPVLAYLVVLAGGICAFRSTRDESIRALIRFILDGAVGLAIVIYVVYTRSLAQSNLEIVKSMRSQNRQWVRDSKKQEYRALLDALSGCVKEIIELRHGFPSFRPKLLGQWEAMNAEEQRRAEFIQGITAAFLEASRVLANSLFIDEALKKQDVCDQWRRLEEMGTRPAVAETPSTGRGAFSIGEFSQAWDELATKIREIARRDLEQD